MLAGCHVSISDGYLGAAKSAQNFCATAYQYFPKNPRSLLIKDFNKQDALLCKEFCLDNKIVSVAHTPYPTSLTPAESKRDLTVRSLLNDLEIAEACGSLGVVVHFGNQVDVNNPLIGYELMISVLNEVLKKWSGNALLLIENIAGIPGTMGTTLEEQVQIRNLCEHPEKIGFCFDTCHAFASSLWIGENSKEFMEKGLNLGYFEHLKVIHLNNSKYESGLGIDRHANIMTGKIKVDFITELITSKEMSHLLFILETPGDNHKEEIAFIRNL
ncbi:deoxyribonuclease IV [Bacillus sp. DJP31]|uniref:deoxyribonuclease IV n=1 Tax=Bacillus sp. DJP31 TaxID=3409789 RepID=UPI003BB6DBA0